MISGNTPSRKYIGLFLAIVVLTTAAVTNAAGFSFMDSVKEFFGLTTVSSPEYC